MMLKFLSRVTGRVGRCVSRSRFKRSRRVKSCFLGQINLSEPVRNGSLNGCQCKREWERKTITTALTGFMEGYLKCL